MQSRRFVIFLILLVVVALGAVLFINVHPSQLFRIETPKPGLSRIGNIEAQISSTIASVSATDQAKSQAKALQTQTLLENPRYTGQDALGRSWTLTAATAGQEGTATSGTYVLEKVQALWNDPSSSTPLTVNADKGRYQPATADNSQDTGKGNLQLNGNVIANGMGFTVTAEQVDADLATRELNATGGSRVQGSKGKWDIDMTAPNLSASQSGNRLFLTGGVHAILTPKGK